MGELPPELWRSLTPSEKGLKAQLQRGVDGGPPWGEAWAKQLHGSCLAPPMLRPGTCSVLQAYIGSMAPQGHATDGGFITLMAQA